MNDLRIKVISMTCKINLAVKKEFIQLDIPKWNVQVHCNFVEFFLNQSKWKNKKVKKFKEFVSFWGQKKNLYNVNGKKNLKLSKSVRTKKPSQVGKLTWLVGIRSCCFWTLFPSGLIGAFSKIPNGSITPLQQNSKW